MRMVDLMVDLYSTYAPDSDELLFWRWVQANTPNMQQAAEALGVFVAPGPDFVERLQAAITPVLKAAPKAQPD